MSVLETDRLVLRELTPEDAGFILRLLNEPSWLRFIGDKGVRTVEDARDYIVNGPMAMYARHGFGLWLVELRDAAVPIGMCGLIKRDSLEDVDLGYALLPEHWGKGYAREAAAASMAHGRDAVGLRRIVAFTDPDNEPSRRLLEDLGFAFERLFRLTGGVPESKLFGRRLDKS
jgi:RimJ/RimL family protein N-acetyltransferase